MTLVAWLNGRLVERPSAVVGIGNRGFLSGFGVFETLKTIGKTPFALTRHLDRLARSANALEIDLPGADVLRAAVLETVGASALQVECTQFRVRITVAPTDSGAIDVIVTCEPQVPHPDSLTVVTSPWPHNERGPLVGAKTTSYADNLAILQWAKTLGADEAIMADTRGRISEATTANVVYRADGQLVTPSLDTGCLGGVTRELLIEWGLVVEQDAPMEALVDSEEVLLSSSTRDLIPVREMDGRTLAVEGTLGIAARSEFEARTLRNLDP